MTKRDRDSDRSGLPVSAPPPVFFDPSNHRLILFRWGASALAVAALCWLAVFSLSLYYVEKYPAPRLLTPPADAAAALAGPGPASADCAGAPAPTPAPAPAPGSAAPGGRQLLYAYLPSDPAWSGASFGRDCGAIDVLMPEIWRIDLPDAAVVTLEPDTEEGRALARNAARGDRAAAILPVLSITWENADPAADRPFGGADDPARTAAAIMALVEQGGYDGLCLHPDAAADRSAGVVLLLAELAERLALAGRRTCLVLGAESPLWRDGRVVALADLVVLLAFRAPGPDAGPDAGADAGADPGADPGAGRGPAPVALAPLPWFETLAAEAMQTIGRDRLVIAIGAGGYDWVSDSPRPVPIPFAEAMRLVARHHGRVDFSTATLASSARAVDGQGRRHAILLLDAVSVYNQRLALDRLRPAGIAVWGLGGEDPGIWAALAAPAAFAPDRMRRVVLEDYVGYEGEGPLYRMVDDAVPGNRSLARDRATGRITGQTWTTLPRPVTMQRLGALADDAVILSFDDGPSAEFTPRILDILAERRVPAVFFTVGRNMIRFPATVRRMVAEGHEIGSHTFFHPDITVISDLRRHLELGAVQRLMVSITGHSSILFRSPYGRGLGPLTAAQARPFHAIGGEGYAILGSTVVPPDWAAGDPQAIVAAALAQLQPAGGNVIVLHDGGGDRSATVAALPLLIDALRARGYRFVAAADLLQTDRAAIMPEESGLRVMLDGWSFAVAGAAGGILRVVFWLAIALGALRSLAMLVLALSRRHYPCHGDGATPPVTAVIPAFNEAAGILDSIGAALASDYPDLRVVVVDDGSTDGTGAQVLSRHADDPRVTLITEANRGKWKALDIAYTQIDSDIVVAVDADTLLRPDAIRRMVRAFDDPRTGAVAGKVAIGNADSLLTRLQALEYVTAQNIDRRAAEAINGILVVPGAIGAWRTEAVRRAGLYTGQTVTEDADLTIAVLRAGYRVVYEDQAVSVTEAPRNLRSFMRQRLRWSFGMMQTAWKHRRAAREGHAVGWVSIPDLWLFGIGLALVAPFADLVFAASLAGVLADLMQGEPVPALSLPALQVAGYLLLPLLDLVLALLAFAFERRWPWLVLLIPLQRLVYRTLLYITVWRAVWRALTGRLAAWGKFRHLGLRQPEA